MEHFIEGKYNAAFNLWIPAAQRGDQESRAVAESALIKLYQGPSSYDRGKLQLASGVLSEVLNERTYDPNDPKVVKFQKLLDDLGSSKPPATPQSRTQFK